MNKLQLDTDKIDKILQTFEKDRKWLQIKSGVSRQLFWYHMKEKPVKAAPFYAAVWDMDPKDLIK